MPSKQASRTRTRTHSREQHQQPRAWGTRFDSLNTSPPPAQIPSPVPSAVTSPTSGNSPAQHAHTLSLKLFDANEKPTEKRDWADDDVPSTLFSPTRGPHVLDIAGGSTPGHKITAKQPHDASVFVGSLPPDKDEAEVAQLLAQHLRKYANVKNIKIVHDLKGGLCAFVQCENPFQAAQLVTRAQENPQPFMGRYLRCESARARRTLWISYRTPVQFIPCAPQHAQEGSEATVDDSQVKGRWVECGLPDALRIWKPRDVRFPIVTFQNDAKNIGDTSRFDRDDSTSGIAPAFRQKGILFTNLKFDAMTIEKMAEAFGPLESFEQYLIGHDLGDKSNAYPSEHSAGRLPGMATGIWEVKWGHRDDCITALNTLRRIPHLTVTWAKDSVSPQAPRVGLLHTPTSPRHLASHSPREALSPIARGRPFLLLDCTESLSSASPTVRSPSVFFQSKDTVRGSQSLPRRTNNSGRRTTEGNDTDDSWTVVHPQNAANGAVSVLTRNSSGAQIGAEEKENRPAWGEGDFPPLKMQSTTPLQTEPGGLDEERHEAAVDQDPESASDDINQSDTSAGVDTPSLSHPPLVHRRSLSNPVARLQIEIPHTATNAQMFEDPPTPELASTSFSQTPTSAHPDPGSPVYSVMSQHVEPNCVVRKLDQQIRDHDQETGRALSDSSRSASSSVNLGRHEHQRQPTIDPKTIFVGGLEPFGSRPWNEARLREIFEKYGEVEEVRIVNPISKKAGFAFVTFANEQSTFTAIREQHNRSYDGRQIRVQIRDMFPLRGGFKFRGRGLGRRAVPQSSRFSASGHQMDAGRSGGQHVFPLHRAVQPFGHHFMPVVDAPQFQINPHGPHQLPPSRSTETDSATLRSSGSFDAKLDMEALAETDSRTAISITPPSSSLGSSAHAASVAAPVTSQGMPAPQTGYYQQRPWPSSYGTHMYYPMPYGAYGGTMPSFPMPFAPAGHGVDQSCMTGATPVHWSPMYGAAVPFTPFPYTIVPPSTGEAPNSSTATSQLPTSARGQPPLHATGFIQGEHGTLIPVYQPDALCDYMNGSSPTRGAGGARDSSVVSGGFPSTQQQNLVAAQMWHSLPHIPQFIAYPIPPASAVGVSSSTTSPTAVQQPTGQQQMQGQVPQAPNSTAASYTAPTTISPNHSRPQRSAPFIAHHPTTVAQPYFTGSHPSGSIAPPVAIPRAGEPSVNYATPEHSNGFANRETPRRDLGNPQNRFGQGQRHGHGPNFGGGHSPSTVRPANRTMNTPRADHHQNNNSYQQRRLHGHPPPAPHFQLGLNKNTSDGGHSQQQQWMTDYQQ
ncbi:uncharacterized protein FOMMEDRAFT_166994 [Fomitiporia mediterranea MF3/22]|uniref:uncharacterized protein n=1 Tax=Fomitiporia mediterranea (strain MF3/22) TaxID=694068 RepID=UPI0004407AB1|nr:uncharacterized protein FOMMEDRAFT_166994 [Fomitiporia mediterranea MF3/22]EJD03642.1 hypothetical protein FOMMEDRAFT_166994 [Fomitiporia mediterranea MF3/22]